MNGDNIHLTRLQADQLIRLLSVLDAYVEAATPGVVLSRGTEEQRIKRAERRAIRSFIRLLEGR